MLSLSCSHITVITVLKVMAMSVFNDKVLVPSMRIVPVAKESGVGFEFDVMPSAVPKAAGVMFKLQNVATICASETPVHRAVPAEDFIMDFLSGLVRNLCEATFMFAEWHGYCFVVERGIGGGDVV
jgi:hypothetical protein